MVKEREGRAEERGRGREGEKKESEQVLTL